MDLLQIPDECLEIITKGLTFRKYNQYSLVNGWKPIDTENDLYNRNSVIVSKPHKHPGYIKCRKEEFDPIIIGRLCMVSKKFYNEFNRNKYQTDTHWKMEGELLYHQQINWRRFNY